MVSCMKTCATLCQVCGMVATALRVCILLIACYAAYVILFSGVPIDHLRDLREEETLLRLNVLRLVNSLTEVLVRTTSGINHLTGMVV